MYTHLHVVVLGHIQLVAPRELGSAALGAGCAAIVTATMTVGHGRRASPGPRTPHAEKAGSRAPPDPRKVHQAGSSITPDNHRTVHHHLLDARRVWLYHGPSQPRTNPASSFGSIGRREGRSLPWFFHTIHHPRRDEDGTLMMPPTLVQGSSLPFHQSPKSKSPGRRILSGPCDYYGVLGCWLSTT